VRLDVAAAGHDIVKLQGPGPAGSQSGPGRGPVGVERYGTVPALVAAPDALDEFVAVRILVRVDGLYVAVPGQLALVERQGPDQPLPGAGQSGLPSALNQNVAPERLVAAPEALSEFPGTNHTRCGCVFGAACLFRWPRRSRRRHER